ncbi:NAD(P)H-dependent oxidoreductase [Roseisalinus antarcticus]|uniref:FMN-dependent NADH-azoreductase 2 n=1 Tax=Roseisalinus antarcticus TaxID=254357 RepID=A0A1Y5TUN4_9RHOB|nr:NAD(P)H-dependent oxidoreductase [Roseisalinus antarcticus]SLN68390.1 FMN-dependent NADH-azoreductase 2 [Roseisalinus antarcticus]
MPKALVVFSHPCDESFSSALHSATVVALTRGGWEVDDCDLYAEGFSPVLTAQERRDYHNTEVNTAPVQGYVDRLRAADALVLVFPVWNFGYPAILKGYFDRVFLPGVSFTTNDGGLKPCLDNIRKVAAVTTYGATRWRAFLAGDPPRKLVTRAVWGVTKAPKVRYLALNDMNNAGQPERAAFLARVTSEMERF